MESELPSRRAYMTFVGGINNETTNDLINKLTDLEENRKVDEVYLTISTFGGSITDGMALYNFLSKAPFKLIAHNIGNVHSMGNSVFLAAETRYACARSSFTFHNYHWTTQAREYRQVELKSMIDGIATGEKFSKSILVEQTKISKTQANRLFQQSTTLLPDKALALGIIHEIKEFSRPSWAV